MNATAVASAVRGGEPLDAVLRPIHTAWVDEARRFLEPALDPGADFWSRWSAVRYISDDFQVWYRRQRALVYELRPFLAQGVAERLVREGDRVFQLRLELDRLGRRRCTEKEFAAGARDLVKQLGLWCAEIELAAGGITRDDLPAEGAELLGHLEAALRIMR
jgi:hypothetical protein